MVQQVMTPDLLAKCGEALYGPRWQTEMSRDLDVADRTVRRWVSGDTPIPDGVNIDLLRMLTERAGDIDGLLEPLKRA